MYVHFDDFDETEGAWVDDSDEWNWVATPKSGVPPALPVAGAWRPEFAVPAIEKIYLTRPPEHEGGSLLLLVKWKDLAHIHCQWVPQNVLETDPSNRQRVQRFLKAAAAEAAGSGMAATWEIEGEGDEGRGGRTEEEPYNPDFEVVERVCATRDEWFVRGT